MNDKVGRNDPCPCGSGKKYKSCCLNKQFTPPPKSLKDRKITARVMTPQNDENEKPKEKVISVDYNQLMEKSFGDSLKTYVDEPPIPAHPEDYLPNEK